MPEALLETVIGLFFVFLLMSMVSSQIVEWIASYRHWRASDLEKTIRAMLYDPATQSNLDKEALVLADKLYAHPLIQSLAKQGSKPSYIPAGKFALALFDVIVTAGTDTSTIGRARLGLEQVRQHLLTTLPAAASPELLSLLAQIQKFFDDAAAAGLDAGSIAMLPLPPLINDELNGFLKRYSISPEAFNALIQAITTNSDIQLNQIINGVIQLTKSRPELSQLITSLFSNLDTQLAESETRMAAARQSIEQWFNDTMDRAGGWYKRHTQLWLAIVGFVLAVILNVDTVTIAAALWRDPTLRQSVVEQAQKYQPASTDAGTPTEPDQVAKNIRDLNAKLSQDLRLPIGWQIEVYTLQPGESCTPLPSKPGDVWGLFNGTGCTQIQDAVPDLNTGLLNKFLGLLITSAAVSQGAPFWFDLLQKLVNIRSSGKKPGEGESAG